MPLMIAASEFFSVALIVFLCRRLVYQILLVVLPGGRTFSLITPLVIILACAILLHEWLERSLRKTRRPKYYAAVLSAWAVIVAVAIGIAPFRAALEKNHRQYRYTGGGVYTYQPNVETAQAVPGTGKIINYKANDKGERSCQYSNAGKDGGIQLVGDSFIYGLHLDERDTLCSTLGSELARRGVSNPVHNKGIAGLSLQSYMKIIRAGRAAHKPEWIVIGYLSRNDFAPYDTFYELDGILHSRKHQAAAILLGPDTVTKALNWYNNRIVNRDPPPEWITKYDADLKDAASNANVIIVSYIEDDSFTAHIENEFPEIKIVRMNLRRTPENERSGMIIPADGHPTGKANKILSRLIADIIAKK